MTRSMGAVRSVTFITPTGDMHIRLMDNSVDAMIAAAKTLKARYFVTQDGYDHVQHMPIWGVFDMRTASQVVGNTWAIGDPIKTFTAEDDDGAVMFALSKGRA